MLSVAVVGATCFINLLLGAFVLLRNPKQRTSLSFFSVCFFISLWDVSNYITGSTTFSLAYNNIFNRGAFFFALFAVASCVWFSYVFPVSTRIPKKLRLALYSLTSVVALLSMTSLVSGNVTRSSTGLKFSLGNLIVLYIFTVVVFLYLIISNLVRVVLKFRGREKQQAMYILFAFCFPIILGLTTNAILPSLTASWKDASFGPAFTIIFVVTATYSIIRHRLFDLRLAVARSLAYILSILAVVVTYAVAAFGLLDFWSGVHVGFAQGVALALFSALLALVFQPIKRLFDRVTNRVFYRDAYDSQQFFDNFNKAVVSTLDLDELLRKVTEAIAANLKAQYCLIGIKDGDNSQRVISTEKRSISQEDIHLVRGMTPHIHQTVIMTDNIPVEHEPLRRLLTKNDIAVLARITDEVQKTQEGLGYIVLGPKLSGNPYTNQDSHVLEATANELVIAIQNALHFEQIQNFNNTLQQKVEAATGQLRRTNHRLRELDSTKDDFISMASHQLRTPLTSVKGYLSMVLDGDAGTLSDAQRRMLEQSYASSQRMVYLISDLLNLSRLNTGKFVIEPTSVDLGEIVQFEVDQLTETAKSRSIELVYTRPESFPRVMLDETKTHQVVMNFIDNAIYYTPTGGKVWVALEDKPSAVEFTVKDTGIGVPKQVQHKLFSKFYRADNAQKARPDGTGLGLFMAKKVISAQGGAILFESEEGKGSTFGFRFSKSTHKVPEETPEIERSSKVQIK